MSKLIWRLLTGSPMDLGLEMEVQGSFLKTHRNPGWSGGRGTRRGPESESRKGENRECRNCDLENIEAQPS